MECDIYILKDNKYSHIKKAEELIPFFIPVDSEEKALALVKLHESLDAVKQVNQVPEAGQTTAKKTGETSEVRIIHQDHDLCPCYGAYWKSIYEVTKEGKITKKSGKEIYSFDDPECMC
jgi:hypothetical protein